jgi:hypothetical protein
MRGIYIDAARQHRLPPRILLFRGVGQSRVPRPPPCRQRP